MAQRDLLGRDRCRFVVEPAAIQPEQLTLPAQRQCLVWPDQSAAGFKREGRAFF
jgi:hypothetical protein